VLGSFNIGGCRRYSPPNQTPEIITYNIHQKTGVNGFHPRSLIMPALR
jgi:hypothetical protein